MIDKFTELYKPRAKEYDKRKKKQSNKMVMFEINVYGHNSAGYDNFLILTQKNIQIWDIDRFHGRIRKLTIRRQLFDNYYLYINFLDSTDFLKGSLHECCIGFKVPKCLQKVDTINERKFDITSIGLDNYNQLQDYWLQYFVNDLMSLSY